MHRWLMHALLALTLPVLPALAQSNHSPVETLTGSLRSISASDLTIDTGDDRTLQVHIQSNTKYLSNMGKVKASDFEPGDHVTVEATRDNDRYLSATITMNKKGSAQDKESARKPSVNTPPAPVQAATPAPATVSSSADSNNSDRPRLRRTNSDSSDSQSVPSGTSSASRGDSGPPTLRRSAPATQSQPAARPSLSAEDDNGVTRTPAAPPPPAVGSDGEMHGPLGDDPVIDQTREVATSFSQTLPNYIVKQFTTRYVSDSASRGRTSWQALDVVTADLVYLDGKENYLNIMDNGRPTRDASQTGSWSEGEFASSLLALLSPFSATGFSNRRPVTIVNRPAYKYDYTIDQPHSAWRIQSEGQVYQPAYIGSIWIDKETLRVLRIEMAARNMPRSFPIDTTESSLDYDFVLIGSQKYLLPVHSESLSCWRGTSQCSRNVIDFRNYKKYAADSSITFEETVPTK